jgi:pyridoxal phosphate enzyme (YggS family)
VNIPANITNIKARIAAACFKVGRSPDSVSLIAVTKGRDIEQINEAAKSGITDIGENRVQEALLKYSVIKASVKWHMVGHLQTNKVKDAVRIFDLIHSVDGLPLAQEINKQATKINKVQDILLEVKTSPEATKFGITPDDIVSVYRATAKFNNLRVKGLMTIAPAADDPKQARPYFRQLRNIRDGIDKHLVLSMGMSDDYEVAIEEGADIIRIGRALFEG